MPWKNDGRNFTLTGPVANWVAIIKKWYQQDITDSSLIAFQAYLFLVTSLLANKAKEHWNNSIISKNKVAQIDKFVKLENDQIKMSVIDTIDFLAENLSEKYLQAWEIDCRKWVLAYLKKAIETEAKNG
jgi:heme oxygenase